MKSRVGQEIVDNARPAPWPPVALELAPSTPEPEPKVAASPPRASPEPMLAESGDGEPAWLLIVAPPSSGKTEAVRLLDELTAAHLGDVTVAGLLTWSKRGKPARPVGLLTRVERGLVTFGDLSTLLSTSDRGGRDQVFALLRRIYDGEVQRDVGSASSADVDGTLTWSGRLTVLGAVTGVIDNYAAHADALGARWLYCRLPERTTAEKRAAARMARRGNLQHNRETAAKLAAAIAREARARLGEVELSDAVLDAIEDAALVCRWGRAAVPRHGYGAREIDGLPTIEEPPRLVRQLTTVAHGLLALGCTDDEVITLCRRLALDSMAAVRRAVLDVLTLGADDPTTATVAEAAGLHRAVARRTLEDLEAIGVAHGQREGEEPPDGEPDRCRCCWSLVGQEAEVISNVIRAEEVTQSVGSYPPSPQV
jgi:hypothetical protein